MAEEKLDPLKADVKIIFHNPDDYNEVDNYFMDNYDLESQGINPLDLDQVKAANLKLSSDYFNTKLVEPEEQATPGVGGVAAAPGFVPFPYQFDTAGLKKFLVDTGNATLENLAQIGKSTVDALIAEPGEISSIANQIKDWAMSKVGKNITDEEKATIGEAVLTIGGRPLQTTNALLELLDELPDYESVKGFTDTFIKRLTQDTAMQEQVANFIDTQDERKIQQVGGAVIAGELTPRLFRGAVKGVKALQPKAKELFEKGFEKVEETLGTKTFVAPNNQPPKTEVPESVAPTTDQVETFIDENKIGSRIGKKVNRELNPNSNVNFDELIQNEQKLKQNLNLFKYSPSLKLKGTAKQKARQIVDYFKDNLRWIYNTMPKDAVVESKKWYGGANAISKRFAEQYDFTHKQVSAIIAALSPKAEWSNNVTLAERSLDILTNKKDFKLDSQADETIKRLYDPKSDKGKIYYKITQGVSAKKYLDNKKIAAAKRKIFDEISVQLKGLSYNDIDNLTFNNLSLEESNKRKNLLKVLWVRVYDEAYNDSLVPAVKPDGTIGNPIKNKDGSNKKRAWQSYDAIRKVISIYEDGSLENINIQVGNNHKVRSFYNNIVNHLDNDSITIDTHAMAAAHLRPLAQIDLEVTNGFGGMPSNDDYKMLAKNGFVPKKKPIKPATNDTTGDNGTYGFYHQAYKELAEELGIRGNQAQSVIWDGIKRLYDDNYKTLENKKIIFNLWKQWQSGKISIDEVRETILKETNGYKDLAFELTD